METTTTRLYIGWVEPVFTKPETYYLENSGLVLALKPIVVALGWVGLNRKFSDSWFYPHSIFIFKKSNCFPQKKIRPLKKCPSLIFYP